MYGLNEFDIQFLCESKIFNRIKFKLMMNQILNPDFKKIINKFCELKSVLKCIEERCIQKLVIRVEYKFDGQILFSDCVDSFDL
jgi:hypothetical protein